MFPPGSSSPSSMDKLAEAIENTKRSLAESDTFFEKHGLDKTKVYAYLEAHATPEVREEARRATEADRQDIEQQMRDASFSSNSTASPASGLRRRMRQTI